jgi:hypothetical protein
MGILLFIIGLFCFLLVLGAMFGKNPLTFATQSAVVIVAICFVGFVLLIGYLLLNSH